MKLSLPFVGRKKEIGRLRQLHKQRRHTLILGAKGVGKSALIAHLCESLHLRVCPASERLSEICEALMRELGLDESDLHLVRHKNRLLKSLTGTKRAVVFDGVSWTTPKISSFFDCVSERVPVWICSRSEHASDIGHFWQFLWKFERVELHPFHLADTRALAEAAVDTGQIPTAALDVVERLHHLSAGNPQVLCELLDGLAGGRYDPHKLFDLKLLDLDRRIKQLNATATSLHA
jgi:GTPase SAR1 family protein